MSPFLEFPSNVSFHENTVMPRGRSAMAPAEPPETGRMWAPRVAIRSNLMSQRTIMTRPLARLHLRRALASRYFVCLPALGAGEPV
jgi:hypothetical protein